jgi:hypothetical protein
MRHEAVDIAVAGLDFYNIIHYVEKFSEMQ